MPANEIHQNDIGTAFTITIQDGTTAVDISTATTKRLSLKTFRYKTDIRYGICQRRNGWKNKVQCRSWRP